MMAAATPPRTLLRSFAPEDLDPLVAFWNRAFAGRRNFSPLAAVDFQDRVLDCAAFDPAGLILAWHTVGHTAAQTTTLVGMVHAFRPPPASPAYAGWGRHHTLALIYVEPEMRRQGIGERLLRAAENWLYYCPVFVASQAQPCYGALEAPRPPFFGSTQRMGIAAGESELIRFLAHRGYRAHDPGEISLRLAHLGTRAQPPLPDLEAQGLRLVYFSHLDPFMGHEQPDRQDYSHWPNRPDLPYAGLGLVDQAEALQGHISWFPMRQAGWAAVANFWLASPLRGRGLGSQLLDHALYAMAHAPAPHGGYQAVEVQSHLVHHPRAVALYQRRGFEIDEAWVSLVKT
jgi:GNAT superfamily N-acetyltransferase